MNTRGMPVKNQWENLTIPSLVTFSTGNPPTDPHLYITGPEEQLDIAIPATACSCKLESIQKIGFIQKAHNSSRQTATSFWQVNKAVPFAFISISFSTCTLNSMTE